MLVINSHLSIPFSEFELSYARSSGPGGQNVNKVNSKALLRWNLLNSPSLSEPTKVRLLQKLGSRLNQDGELLISSDRHRDQLKNRQDCFDKLQDILAEALHIPKLRKKTKPSKSSKQKKKESKNRHSQKKSLRGKIIY